MEGTLREHLDFVANRRALISSALRGGNVDDSSSVGGLADGVESWLERVSQWSVSPTTDLISSSWSQEWSSGGADSSGWNRQFAGDLAEFASVIGNGVNDQGLDDRFRALEMSVVVADGYSATDAWAVVRALPSIRLVRRRGVPTPAGPLGTGVRSIVASAQLRLQAGFLSVRELRNVLRLGRLATLLAIAIEADGAFSSVAGVFMPTATANTVCRISQHLAEARGYYESAKYI